MSNSMPNPSDLQRQGSDPLTSAWVSASAGTGKTKVLTDRVLSLLITGAEPQKLLCLTFTRAAAAEMETRVLDRLGRWAMIEDGELTEHLTELLGYTPDDIQAARARRLFALVVDTPGGMNIQTIHAFCQSLLRRFPLEARIAPHFSLMEERDAQELLIEAREGILLRAQSGDEPALAAALAEVTRHIHETAFPELIAGLTANRGKLRRLIEDAGGLSGLSERLREMLGLRPGDTIDSILANDSFDEPGLRDAIEVLGDGKKSDQDRALVIAHYLELIDRTAEDFDAYANAYLTSKRHSGGIEIRQRLITKDSLAKSPGVDVVLEKEAQRVAAVLLRLRAVVIAEATHALLHLGQAMLDSYQRHKERRALLDYDDLIIEAGRLLHLTGVAPWVLFKLDGGIDHILIDEAQDTSPDQWRVVDALADEFFSGLGAHEQPRTVFAVGDVKQSIYSFQGADPESFQAMRKLFGERVPAANGRWRELDLTMSFRSTPAVLAAVDAVFAGDAARDGVALDDKPVTHQAWRSGAAGLVELWPPIEPREIDPPSPWKPPVERILGDSPQTRLAKLVAGKIARLIGDGEMLEARGRAIEPGDIMVLVRRRTGFVEDLVRALKELAIEVAGVDRMTLTEQIAVMDLIALGRVLLLPEDDLTLATVLKGPLVGLSEEQLFDLAYRRNGTLWQALRDRRGENGIFGEAYAYLSQLLARADFVQPFELFNDILGTGRGREKLLARLGPDAQDPIAEFLNLAIAYERSHVPTLEGFLYWMDAGGVEIKRDLDHETRRAVRVMTVHGAKGLQAPIVFLPDTLQAPSQGARFLWPDDAFLWPPRRAFYEDIAEREADRIKRERDREYRRLLYVAMTRAEDRLYVCGWRTKKAAPEGCWYNLIRQGLESVGEEVGDAYLSDAGETASNDILRLTNPQTDELTDRDAAPVEDWGALPQWAVSPAPIERTPPAPLTPSRPDGEEPTVVSPLGTDLGFRFKRGRIIHALLQTLPDMAAPDRHAAAAHYVGRAVHGLEPSQQTAIVDETLAVLNHPEFAALFGPGSRAEVPLIGEVAGQIMSAQLDRILITDSEILVVDYKTNRPPPTEVAEVAEIYLAQMAAYRVALAAIYPARNLRTALLWTDGPILMPLPDDLLAAHAPRPKN